jgi:hypothetical protein
MHEGIPHITTTASGLGALNALGALADAFAGAVPSKGDFDAAVKRRAQVKISGVPLKTMVPALTGANPAAAKAALRKLTRAIDARVTAARAAEKRAKAGNKKAGERAKALRAVVRDLRTISLYVATKFQTRALTMARGKGIKARAPSVKDVSKLSQQEESGKMTIGEEIPSGVPAVAPEISYMGMRADELAGDDTSELGAALAGYAGACGCGYGDAVDDDDDDDDGGVYDVDEDAQLFIIVAKPDAKTVEDATVVYPGAAKALGQGFLTRNAQLAARAFTFLRRQRLSNADVAWAAPQGSPQQLGALRAMSAANTLILHWAHRFYQRYLEDLARARAPRGTSLIPSTPRQVQAMAPAGTVKAFQTQMAVSPVAAAAAASNPVMQLKASAAAKNEAASAAAAVLKSGPGSVAASAAAMKDPTAQNAMAAAIKDLREELTQDILSEATEYGRAVAQKHRVKIASTRRRLSDLLSRRRGIIVRQLGLNAGQARALFALESQIMGVVADRAGNEWRLAHAKTPPARAKITTKITENDKRLELLRTRRRGLLKFAKAAKSGGFAGLMADVGDALGDLGWAGVGLGAAGLLIGGAIGSR